MKYSRSVKPISYLKAHASEIIREINTNRETIIITHNGEARAVVQDIHVYEETQDTLALLKILALSTSHINQGQYKPARKAFEDIQKEINKQTDR